MPSIEQVNQRNLRRVRTKWAILTSLIAYPISALLIYFTYQLIEYASTYHIVFIALFVPFCILIVSLFKLFFNDQVSWPALKIFILIVVSFFIPYTIYLYFTKAFDFIKYFDLYLMVFIIVGFISKKPLLTSFSIAKNYRATLITAAISIIVAFTLAFHVFAFNYLILYPKAEFTFQNSLVTGNDVKKIIDDINSLPPKDQSKAKEESFVKTLELLGIIVYNDNTIQPVKFDKDFQRKHIDALVKVYYKDEIKKTFFPSGYFYCDTSYLVNGYYLKNIHVKYNTEFGYMYEVRLVFKNNTNQQIMNIVSTDIDDKDSIFTAPIKNKDLGTFNIIGKYLFKHSPNEIPSGEVAVKVSYSNYDYMKNDPMNFRFLKPDIQN